MAEYIDRDKLIAEGQKDGAFGYVSVEEIAKFPAADVVERKKGLWVEKALDTFRKYSVTCPFCGAEYIDNYDGYVSTGDFNFCPNCGADMRGEDNG